MKISSEERILAVLSHLSALAMGMGLVVPVVLWASQRGKSRFAAFHALQAYGYQSLGYTVYMLFMLLVFVLVFTALFFIALLMPNASQNDTISSIFAVVLIVAMLASMGLYLVLPVLAAIFCGLGRDFCYPLLGRRLAAFFHFPADSSDDAALGPAAEERWLAAMGHFAVIIPLWGLAGPLYLWLAGAKGSFYLTVQSAQTTLYQGLVNILYLLSFIFGAALFLLSLLLLSAADKLGMAGLAVALVLLCIFGLFTLVVPMFHILGQWAGLRVLQGHDFRYPLIGLWVDDWLTPKK